MFQNFIIPYLYEAQHVSGDTPPIIRSLKLHWQPLGFHAWKVVGRVAGGRCQAQYVPDNVYSLQTLYLTLQFVNLMFVDPSIIVQFIKKKSNKMQQFIKIYYSVFI